MFTQDLANFVSDAWSCPMAEDLLLKAQDAFIDCLGVGLAGSLEPVTEKAIAWSKMNGTGSFAIFGQRTSVGLADAALINAISSHALDFDDSHPNLRGHPSVTLVPTALAIGQMQGSSGKDVLKAYVLGLEIAGKLGRAVGEEHFMKGWHSTATMGAFGATTVAACLLGLNSLELQHAWGLLASQTSGLVRNFGTMTKPFHAGHAARSAIQSAWLVKQGFTSDPIIFDGKNSFLDTYGGRDRLSPKEILSYLGSPWEIVNPGVYVKGWPCCYSNHRAIGGLFGLIEKYQLVAEEIENISIGFLPGTDTALVSKDPKTGLEGKFSIEYVLSAIFLDGELTLETFSDEMVMRGSAQSFIKKIQRYAIEDEKIYSGISGYTDLTVSTSRGEFKTRIDKVPGSPAWPLSEKDKKIKFIDCAKRAIGPEQSEELYQEASHLMQSLDLRKLIDLLIPIP
ncbi:MmgE/PrpD family protein [Polynucleobacter rarus]|uniref:MmgE/PrpD family protein n=1 Tax=Polynucleobacter rarus TaxID=556055 RepID=UPI000D3ED3D6|nr:MmgE/PrpD family protein [Polynucleobacter rarus]